MKVAMIGQKGIPAHSGGIERHVEELSAELSDLGHEVIVYCRKWYVAEIRPHRGVSCVSAPSINSKHLDAITHTFTSILKAARANVDVFHIHGVGPALLSWLPKLLKPSAHVIVTFHCIDRHHQKWNWFARACLQAGEWMAHKFPDATIAVSKTLHDYSHLSYGSRTMYIPNGTQIPTETTDRSLLEPFDLESGSYLMMCARLVRHKGQHMLIQAWKELRMTRPDLTDEKKLAIVGGSAFTDEYVRELHEMAKGDHSIVFTGSQTGETLRSLFMGSYAAVHPSESEGLPVAVLEAMSYGKCVLSSDIPENLELTKEYGLSFRTGDKNDLVEKMAMLLEHPEYVKNIGDEARGHVSENYDWKDIAEKTSYLYEAIDFKPTLKEAT